MLSKNSERGKKLGGPFSLTVHRGSGEKLIMQLDIREEGGKPIKEELREACRRWQGSIAPLRKVVRQRGG